jgi:copper homeostasis protein CutC
MGNEMKEPMIFSVMTFRQNDDGTFKLDVHYVAGVSSADAETRILNCAATHLANVHRFIQTDEHMEVHPDSVRLYSTRYTNSDSMSAYELDRWISSSTTGGYCDGDHHPATFRRF